MPEVAAHVDACRAEWGAQWVNDCIRNAMPPARKPGFFWACEAGHVLGTPGGFGQETDALIARAVAMGSNYVCVLRPPGQQVPAGAAKDQTIQGATA
jgi:hypothetical protein